MYYDTSLFPWLKPFQDNWERIRDEVVALGDTGFMPWPEREYYNFGWRVYGLYGWGVRLDKHADACPYTTSLVEQVPGLSNAGFSRMNPQTHIRRHRNEAPEGILRAHVPLIVPEGCVFCVEETERTWTEGECFVFDDCLYHEAWNHSHEQRIVLLIDFPAHDLVYHKPRPKRVKGLWDKLTGARTEFNYLPVGKTREQVMVRPPDPA